MQEGSSLMKMETNLKSSKLQDAKAIAAILLNMADIKINGKNPWDLQVHNEGFYQRVLRNGSLGLGEAYMDGWWHCQAIDELMARILKARLDTKIKKNKKILLKIIINRLFNLQTMKRALIVGRKHYDVGNELYQHMLDKTMTYSCAYWKDAADLDQAQLNKLDLICRKLELKPGMQILDIGCGWGGLAKYAAENYGVSVVGITISRQQQKLAEERCKNLPVKIIFQDYRELNEVFDRIVSVGMFEHVGYKNYAEYMHVVRRCLKDDGLFLLHTIGSNSSVVMSDPWIQKYIFPNGMLPSMRQIIEASDQLFIVEDWHNFGADYDKTLMAWHKNFNNHWDRIKEKFDDRFFRMWNYYLLACAGAFRARDIQLWQIVFSKRGLVGGYQSVR